MSQRRRNVGDLDQWIETEVLLDHLGVPIDITERATVIGIVTETGTGIEKEMVIGEEAMVAIGIGTDSAEIETEMESGIGTETAIEIGIETGTGIGTIGEIIIGIEMATEIGSIGDTDLGVGVGLRIER